MTIYIYLQTECVTLFHVNENSFTINVTVLFSSCTACHFVTLLYSEEPGLTLHNTPSFVLFYVLPSISDNFMYLWRALLFLIVASFIIQYLHLWMQVLGVGRRVCFNDSVPTASKLCMTFYRMLIRLPPHTPLFISFFVNTFQDGDPIAFLSAKQPNQLH